MAYIISVKRECEEFDPRFSRNGGSYEQPFYTARFSDGTIVTIDDCQCGDFGGEIIATITHNRRTEKAGYWAPAGENWEEPYSSIPAYWARYLIPVQWAIGVDHRAYAGLSFREEIPLWEEKDA